MAARVSGRGDDGEVRKELPWFCSVDNDFRAGLRAELIAMDYTFAAKFPGKLSGFGDVITVSKKDVGDPTQFLKLFSQRRNKLRRIDQPIPIRMLEKVTVAAVGFG